MDNMTDKDRLHAYQSAIEQMLAHEVSGGAGWWKGWEMLVRAHEKATGKNVREST